MTVRFREVWDAADQVLYHQRVSDADELVREIAAQREALDNGFNKSRNWRKIGEIPMDEVDNMFKAGINVMDYNRCPIVRRRVRQWLNENRKFRTTDKPL